MMMAYSDRSCVAYLMDEGMLGLAMLQKRGRTGELVLLWEQMQERESLSPK